MAELADVQDLGSCAARRVGSTPITRTTVYEMEKFDDDEWVCETVAAM